MRDQIIHKYIQYPKLAAASPPPHLRLLSVSASARWNSPVPLPLPPSSELPSSSPSDASSLLVRHDESAPRFFLAAAPLLPLPALSAVAAAGVLLLLLLLVAAAAASVSSMAGYRKEEEAAGSAGTDAKGGALSGGGACFNVKEECGSIVSACMWMQ